jgi:hypothetical protein
MLTRIFLNFDIGDSLVIRISSFVIYAKSADKKDIRYSANMASQR